MDRKMSIEDIMYPLKRRWKAILAITGIVTVLVGLVTFTLIKPKYETTVRVFVGKEGAITGEGESYNSNDLDFYQKLMGTYAELVKTNDSIKKALKDIGQATSQDNIDRVKESLYVTQNGSTQIMNIRFVTTDKSELIPVIESVTDVFIDNSQKLISNGNVQVIEMPIIPKGPFSPNKVKNLIIGLLGGFILSIGVVFFIEYFDNTIKTKGELEELLGIPVLGSVPMVDESSEKDLEFYEEYDEDERTT